MVTMIYELSEKGVITKKAEYCLEPKSALVAYIRQKARDWNTWDYPDTLPGMRQVAGNYYYDDGTTVIAAYPA